MKNKMRQSIFTTAVIAVLLCTQTVQAQWSLTGNTGTTPGTNFIGTIDQKALYFKTKNATRMVIGGTGNVGIGTTSPANKLSVNGNANFTGNVGIGTTTPVAKLDVSGGEVWCTNPGQGFVHSDGNIQLATYLDGAGAWLGTNTNHSLLFYTNNSAASSIAITPLGNIGMGTANPTTAKLVIAGPANSQGIDLSSSNVYANMRVLQNSNSSIDKDMYFGFQSGATSALHLYSNNGETMTIAHGKVGIGWADPHAQLHLTNQIANRRIILWESANNDHQFAGFGVNSNILRYQVEGTNGNHIFYAAASATTSNELMRIQGDGRVCIGTSTPTTSKLVIGGTAGAQGLDLSTSDQYANMRILQNTNSSSDKDMYIGYQSGATSSLHLYSNNSETITVKGSKVGINQGDPHAQLQLGNLTANRRIVLWEGANNDHQFAGFGMGSNILRYQVEGTSGNHIFYAAASASASNELMRIQGDGRVSIGSSTAATGYKLTVAGKIICTELKVQVQPFPDYVFAHGYNLKSIDEVEQHIKTYNRLPGMPSACEVEENGMNVGDMQTKVVEKVEENTLYIIQLKKEIDALKAQLDALKK